MSWIIALPSFGCCWWLTRRATERATELAPTGLLRSPLYWFSNALVLVFVGLVIYIAHMHHQSPVPSFFWFTVVAVVVTLLVMRRALKSRYPI